MHPECTPDVRAAADYVGSTTGILKYCAETDAREFIVGTELEKENPGKRFFPTSDLADCPNMKLITLEKVLWSLEDGVYRVEVPADVADPARRAIERMLE